MPFQFFFAFSGLVGIGKCGHIGYKSAAYQAPVFKQQSAFFKLDRAAVFACDFLSGPGDCAFLDVDLFGLCSKLTDGQESQ